MIGIVVVTHAGLAVELLRASETILGSLEAVAAVSVERDRSIEAVKEELHQVVSHNGADGEGVLILTDLFGGTPTNISAEFLGTGRVEILTGVNLPMLIKSVSARGNHDLDSLTAFLQDYAKNAIMRPSELLRSVC